MINDAQSVSLLLAARQYFCEKIQPNLHGADRYEGAMLVRILDVLQRQSTSTHDTTTSLVDAGFDTAGALAKAFRTRAVKPSANVSTALRGYVEAKLRISNPTFLDRTNQRREGTEK